jgi:beta-lactamase superfamily II metal-dependent hydrolase
MGDFTCVIWKVEHGSAALIRTTNNKTIMLDAGCSDDFGVAEYLNKYYSIDKINNRLNALIISHADHDHIQDLPNVLEKLYPIAFYRNRQVPPNVNFPNGLENINTALESFHNMELSYIYDLDEAEKLENPTNWANAEIKLFHNNNSSLIGCPADKMKNNLSLVTVVHYDELEIVFPGDLEPLGAKALTEKTDILDYIGKGITRILVAPHHGRASGIRWPDDTVATEILIPMKPHLVIMSDKRGADTTDAAAYLPYSQGFDVIESPDNNIINKKVITTKTNNYVLITVHPILKTIVKI